MKKRELLDRIERLERRVSQLEAENLDLRCRLTRQNWIYPVYPLREPEPEPSEYPDNEYYLAHADRGTGSNPRAFEPEVIA